MVANETTEQMNYFIQNSARFYRNVSERKFNHWIKDSFLYTAKLNKHSKFYVDD